MADCDGAWVTGFIFGAAGVARGRNEKTGTAEITDWEGLEYRVVFASRAISYPCCRTWAANQWERAFTDYLGPQQDDRSLAHSLKTMQDDSNDVRPQTTIRIGYTR